ncbi:protein neprosin-like [Nicotiana tomentosiformis]|uniref:protein neprosin-like n=1 Tax=Nicotiana tomentosiformis TaxID=4098 RepID=UPI00388CAEF6
MNEFRMHQRIVQQTLLMLYFLLSYNGVQGEKNLSKLEDAELEKQLKLLNKPAVKIAKGGKTILLCHMVFGQKALQWLNFSKSNVLKFFRKRSSLLTVVFTKYGDIYDCIDFYKQHAFDHPLLKDHNYHPKMKPTLSRVKQNSDASTTSRSSTIWSKDGGCPFGTVPIKRITKDDLIRQRRIPPPENVTFGSQSAVSNNNSEAKGRYISSQGYKLAIAQILNNPNNKFAGAGMATNFYNPRVEGQQHSACRLKIQKDSDILQVGWRVDPTLYGDSKTRLFIHLQADKIHCFNTLCPGFVQVSSEIPLDMSFEDYLSRRGGAIWEEKMYIDRDLANGNWWLLMEKDYKQVGFWPQRIFTGLTSFATNVEWGGVVYSPPGVPEPFMGSSFFPIKDSAYDAYCTKLTILNEEGKTFEVDNVTTHADNPNMYKVLFGPLWDDTKPFLFVLYGGPGERAQV